MLSRLTVYSAGASYTVGDSRRHMTRATKNPKINYDQIAPEYDQRFAPAKPVGTEQSLLKLTDTLKANRILEVGCGTGHWLAALYSVTQELYGLDLSAGMLSQAQKRMLPIRLVWGCAERLPFKDSFFDLVFCVNAIHHFDHPQMFICEAYRVLSADGTLAVIGTDPHGHKDSWYGFHFFEGTYETDLKRFPAWPTVSGWMTQAGFERTKLQEVERIIEVKQGREVLNDPYLRKNACSRLALLSDAAYNAGLKNIETAVAQAEARGETIVFRTDILISMLTSYKARADAA